MPLEATEKYRKTITELNAFTLTPHSFVPLTEGFTPCLELFAMLGNPQDQFKSIHIAGTSGKGSTATIMSHLLQNQGFKTGLTLSPHLLDLRERVQINNSYISEAKFIKYYAKVKPAVLKLKQTTGFHASYFVVMLAIAFCAFAEEGVDYAVIETGLGGTFDATNTIHRPDKLAIITKIGFDHIPFLGPTLSDIARHKAGIIQKHNLVIVAEQKPHIFKVFEDRCQEKQAELIAVKQNQTYTINSDNSFDYEYKGLELQSARLNMLGDYQKENASLALTALVELSLRDNFTLNKFQVLKALAAISFIGRFNIYEMQSGSTLILDGAHNPQKMSAFCKSLQQNFPEKKFTFILAFKEGKAYGPILKYILPLAQSILITSFNIDNAEIYVAAENVKTIAQILERMQFKNYKFIQASEIKNQIQSHSGDYVLTGSLFFIADQLNSYNLLSIIKRT